MWFIQTQILTIETCNSIIFIVKRKEQVKNTVKLLYIKITIAIDNSISKMVLSISYQICWDLDLQG